MTTSTGSSARSCSASRPARRKQAGGPPRSATSPRRPPCLVVIVVAGAFLLARGLEPGADQALRARRRSNGQRHVHGVDDRSRTPARTGDRPLGHDPARAPAHGRSPASASSGTGNEIVVTAPEHGARTRARHGSLVSPRPDGSRSSTGRPTRSRRTARPSHRSSRRRSRRRSRSARAPGRRRPASPARERCRVARQPRWPRSDPDQASSRPTAPSVALGASADRPSARFYVLANLLPALSSRDIAHPKEVRDPNAGGPDVTFGFTSTGAVAFRALTKRVAERGQRLSSLGPDVQPALRDRARRPADQRPLHRLQGRIPMGSPRRTARTSPAASRPSPPRTWPRSCATARCP